MELTKKYIYEQLAKNNLSIIDARKMLQELQKKQQEPKTNKCTDIAIIGIAGRFGEAEDIDEFWELIKAGKDFIRDLPESRQSNVDEYLECLNLTRDDVIVRQGAYLEEIDRFEPEFFGISSREASLMDPNQRLFLETAWKAMEDAGYGGGRLAETRTGIFVGFSHDFGDTYKHLIKLYSPSLLPMSTLGNIHSVIAGRISYLLDLKGPSMLVDTACSSSLVAVHLACQSIINGDSDLAIAGGVKIWNLPAELKSSGEFGGDTGPGIGIESKDGRCHTFDDCASGAGFGEGSGAILLKPLDQAIKDKDSIYAVIKGSAINQDGNSIGLSAPNISAQEEVIQKAWKNAGIEPETISYIEAHGTGTKLGDPIEIYAIQNSFTRYTDQKHFCGVGSVKSNLGHLDNAAGIVGLMKVILSLKNKILPPNINFTAPNKEIDFINSPVYVNNYLRSWEIKSDLRRAGVSAFGLSGTNCHIILEEAPEEIEKTEVGYHIFTISAHSEDSLKKLIQSYVNYLQENKNVSLANLCYTANTGRGQYQYRLAMIVKDIAELITGLRQVTRTRFEDIMNGRGVYYNNLKNKKNFFNSMSDQSINKIENDKEQLKKLAQLYIQGAEINWVKLYRDKELRRIHLPVYQFNHKKCWIEPDPTLKRQNSFKKRTDVASTGFYQIVWTEEKIETISEKSNETILIFKDQNGYGEKIKARLEDNDHKIIEVTFGKGYSQMDECSYVISTTQEDVDRLLTEIPIKNISRIIHLSSLNRFQKIESITDLDSALRYGVDSFFYLIKSIKKHKLQTQIQIHLISDYANEVTKREELIKPENATVFGLGKVVNQEYPESRCRCIDIDVKTSVQEIINEIYAESDAYLVAYRENRRYVEELQKAKIAPQEKNMEFKEEGVYVITGGLGGIGLEVAKSISQRAHVNVALIGRSKLPLAEKWEDILEKNEDQKLVHKIKTIQEIKANGSNTLLYSGDVSSYEEMSGIINDIRKKYGKINGVIHAAGVGGDGFIINKELEEFMNVLLPKVYGTWILDDLTCEDELEFFVLFSSISAIFGGPGQGDYTAGNLYLNKFADYRNKSGQKTTSISWTAWKETGMAVNHNVDFDSLIFKPMNNKKGLAVFEQILKADVSNVLVGEINSREFDKYHEMFPIKLATEILASLKDDTDEPKDVMKRSNLQLTENVGDIERKVAEIWAGVLGVDQLSVHDHFNDLGGDSIIALTLINNINKELGNVVGVTDLFSYSTIRELSGYIIGKLEKENEKSTVTDVERDILLTDDSNEEDEALMDLLTKLEEGSLSSKEGLNLLSDLEE